MFRPMRRFKQQLTDDECLSILRREPRGVLSLCGDDGYPYGVPMNYVYDEGCLSTKAKNSPTTGRIISTASSCSAGSPSSMTKPKS